MITSTENRRIKEIIQLQKKSKIREREGVFVAEGLRMVREAPPEQIVGLYATEAFYKKYKAEIPQMGTGQEIELVSPRVFEAISDTKTPQGVLAVIRKNNYTEREIRRAENAHILILEDLQDPGNVGTIFRTAEAAGVTGILLTRGCVDIYNPKTVRSTMGALFRMPFACIDNLPETVSELKAEGTAVYAAHLKGTSDYDQEDYTGRTAFLIGNEGNGLSEEAANCADKWIRIPMEGQAESLNAAVAAAVMVYEVSRQRRARRNCGKKLQLQNGV